MDASSLIELSSRAQRALDAGNHREVRRIAKQLEANGDSQTAKKFLNMVAIDPAQFVFLGLCLMFLLGVVWRYAL